MLESSAARRRGAHGSTTIDTLETKLREQGWPTFAELVYSNVDMHWIGYVLILSILILSLALHEVAHGWTALRCGDSTARDLGRLSLNPLVHLDLYMSVVVPLMTFYFAGMVFGGAKPVPVDFYRLRRGHRDMALVALAGPLSNLLIALVLLVAHHALVVNLGIWERGAIGPQVLLAAVQMNIVLTIFNLLPIPPLDGSRVLAWLLPERLRDPFVRLESIGMFLVMGYIVMAQQVPSIGMAFIESIESLFLALRFVGSAGAAW